MQKYTNATITVHICTVTVVLAFNIYIYLFFFLVSNCFHSPFFSFDQIIRPAKPLNRLPPLISCHRHWSLADRHEASPIATAIDLSPIATKPLWSPHSSFISRCLINGFWVRWVVIWLSFVSCCLIGGFSGRGIDLARLSGFSSKGVDLAELNGLAFLDAGG